MAELGEGLSGYLDVQDATLRAPRIEAVSNIGIANTNPQHAFSVGSNLYIDTESSDVLTVKGNVVTEGIKMGFLEITPSYDLAAVSNVGNITSNTIIFDNPIQGFVATGNATIGSTLTVTGFRITAAAAAQDDLEAITTDDPGADPPKVDAGRTPNAIHITNATESTTPYTGALQIGTNTGANGGLGVAGNVHVNQGVYTQDLSVSGEIVSNLAVNTDDLFVDIVNSRVGIGKTEPTVALDVVGAVNASGNVAVDTNTLFVDTVGSKVGVGTTEPGATLEVTGNAYVSSNLEVGTANLFVDTVNSRVGIGAASPDTLLHLEDSVPILRFVDTDTVVDQNQALGGLEFYSRDSTADGYPNYELASMKCINSANAGTAPDGELTFSTGRNVGTGILERMRINADGNVGIGTNSPQQKLHLVGVGNDSGPRLRFETLNNGNGEYTVSGKEIGGIQFGADDLTWATQHMSSEIVGIQSEPGYSGARGILAFKTSSSQGSNPTEKMRIRFDGNVGIGTAVPYAKLHIHGTGNINSATGSRSLFYWGTNFQRDTGGFNDVSFYTTGPISTSSWIVSLQGAVNGSDERIKKEIVDVEDGSALETLRLLKPKQYKYVDEVQRGSEPVWGFIAQEVRETLPYATQTRIECLPNIYELANVSASNVITFTNFDTSNLESNAMVLKVFDKDDMEHLVNITEVVDDHSVRVDEDLSEWTGSVDESGNVVAGNQLFVYGQQVDDFVFLKKDAIWTVATSALQEVDRQLQAEKAKVITLETQLTSVLTRLDALEGA